MVQGGCQTAARLHSLSGLPHTRLTPVPCSPCTPAPSPAALDGYAKPRPDGMGYASLRTVSAAAIKAGSDLACQNFDGLVPSDVNATQLNAAVLRVLRNRFRCGGAAGRTGQGTAAPASLHACGLAPCTRRHA